LAALLRLAPTPWSEPQRMALMLAEAGSWPRVYGLLRNVWDAPDLRRRLYGPRLLDQPFPDAFDELAARWPQAPDPVTAAARFEWREKMVQQLLPGEILTRPKSGFQVDAGAFWQQLQPLAETWLSDEAVRRHGLFNPEFVRRLRGQRPRTGLRWNLGSHNNRTIAEQGVQVVQQGVAALGPPDPV